MIPKIIHYIWLSDEKLNRNIKNCINSWHKLASEYEIRRWSMTDFDIESMPGYVKDAIAYKKWAFACDYLRLYVLEKEGGLYLDSDVLMVKNPDAFMEHSFVSSVEYYDELFLDDAQFVDNKGKASKDMIKGMAIQAAVLGSEAHHPFIKACLEHYQNKQFNINVLDNPDNLLAPHTLALVARGFGFKYVNQDQQLDYDMHLYKSDIFAPGVWNCSEDSVMIHMCNASWRNIDFYDRLRLDYRKRRVLKNHGF